MNKLKADTKNITYNEPPDRLQATITIQLWTLTSRQVDTTDDNTDNLEWYIKDRENPKLDKSDRL